MHSPPIKQEDAMRLSRAIVTIPTEHLASVALELAAATSRAEEAACRIINRELRRRMKARDWRAFEADMAATIEVVQ
jgi:hypothetical protein